MSKLTPVKRVDKNGVLTTKHVRIDDKKKPLASSMPAPQLGPAQSAPVTASTIQKRWRINKKRWGDCDTELQYLCTKRYTPSQTYECSEAEAYEVLSVVHPKDALPLLAIGMRTAEQTLLLLEEAGVSRLKYDSSELVSRAVERGVSAVDIMHFGSEYHGLSNIDRFLDTAECAATTEFRNADYSRGLRSLRPVRDLILDGTISWPDIKVIGTKKVAEMTAYGDVLIDILTRLHRGESRFTSISEIAEITKTSSRGRDVDRDLDIADACGIEVLHEIADMDKQGAFQFVKILRGSEHTQEQMLELFDYSRRAGMNPRPEYVVALYDAGIAAEVARQGVIDGLEANQIIGITSGEAQPSLSSGYL